MAAQSSGITGEFLASMLAGGTPIAPKPPEAAAETPGMSWRDVKRKADKVALVGFASTSRSLAPWADESFEIWVLNDLCRQVPRWNRMFEVHPREYLLRGTWQRPDGQVNGDDYWLHLCGQPGPDKPDAFCPIYTVEQYPEMPASVAYPFDAVRAKFNAPWGEDYYQTSTPAQMLALAIMEGFKEIHLYGIDLISDEEYAYQRGCLEYYVGFGRGMGVNVVVPAQSALCKASYCYGKSFPVEPGTYGALRTIVNSQKCKVEDDVRRQLEGCAATFASLQLMSAMDGLFNRALAKQETKLAKLGKRKHRGPRLSKSPVTARMLKVLRRQWFRYSQQQRAQMSIQHRKVLEAFHTANGTIAGLASIDVWAGHLERGGVVNP
jgi:hypothetical protein